MTLYNVMRFTNTTHLIQVEANSEDEARSMAELISTDSDQCVFIDEEFYDVIPEPWKEGDN